MSRKISQKHFQRRQRGYALLIVIFLIALMAISVLAVAPNLITNAKREREEEMIWRGKQYVRGIRLFYAKNHRFPAELEDLYKPKTGVRFLRQAYKDPTNSKDGSWRMIYVGPNGVLIGSLKNRTVNLAGQPAGGFGGPNSSAQGGLSPFGSSNGFGSASSFSSNNASATPNTPVAPSGTMDTTTTAQPSTATAGGAVPADPYGDGDPALQTSDLSDGTVIGGNIIGVGGKVNQRSIIWFEKAKNYRQFEFIWDPSVDALTGARPAIGTAAPGNPFSNGNTPPQNPGTNPGMNPDPNGTPPLQAPQNPQ